MHNHTHLKGSKTLTATFSSFVILAVVLLLALLAISQPVFAADIGTQLSNMGRDVSRQAITLISDIFQFAVGPILLAVSIVFLIIKIIMAFVGNRKGEEIDIKGLIISGIGVVVASLLIALRIDSFFA